MAINPVLGNVIWRYRAGGTASNSAAVQQMKDLKTPYLWFTAEDGCLYALNAYAGTLAWKLNGTPTNWQSPVNYDVPNQLFYNYTEALGAKLVQSMQ